MTALLMQDPPFPVMAPLIASGPFRALIEHLTPLTQPVRVHYIYAISWHPPSEARVSMMHLFSLHDPARLTGPTGPWGAQEANINVESSPTCDVSASLDSYGRGLPVHAALWSLMSQQLSGEGEDGGLKSPEIRPEADVGQRTGHPIPRAATLPPKVHACLDCIMCCSGRGVVGR